MRSLVPVLALVLACSPSPTAEPDAGADAGHDAGQDAGRDLGTDTGADLGTDAGVDTGPACECSTVGPCCDGCNALHPFVECRSVAGPDRCWPDSYVSPGFRGYVETRTYCGETGECDGEVRVVDSMWSCGSGYCYVRSSDQQAICAGP